MNIIYKIQGKKDIDTNLSNLEINIKNIKLLIEYILLERNYYNLLHNNNLRNFGSYIDLITISDEDKSEQLMYMLNNYCKSYYIFYVKIIKNSVIIKFKIDNNEYTIDHIIENINFQYRY